MEIVLPVTTENKDRLNDAGDIALSYNGKVYAILKTPEFFPHRKEERAARQFGTTNSNHPHIKVTRILKFVYICVCVLHIQNTFKKCICFKRIIKEKTLRNIFGLYFSIA